MEDSN